MTRSAIVIGAGFAGLSAAASLGRKGFAVTVVEKNESAGGRARVWREGGFVFDLGPSWYWMPEIFEEYFSQYGRRVEDFYDLRRLDPSYQVIFDERTTWHVPAGVPALKAMFDKIEPGSGAELDRFLAEARMKYELGMNDLVRKPALSWMEYAKWRVVSGMLSSSVFKSLRSHVKKHFKDERLRMLLEFPVLFLGAAPQNTPALYSLMNHADMALGTWYPMGGMGRLVDAMVHVAEDQGVRFKFNSPVNGIVVKDGHAVGVKLGEEELHADVVVAAADYHHVEADLLAGPQRDHTEAYWQSRSMAPSSLIFYFGIDRRLSGLLHHNLFFDEALDQHSHEIYTNPQWPSKPLMYVCCPSITDASVAPAGNENLFVLIPIAVGLSDTPEVREHYKALVLRKLAVRTGVPVAEHIVVERSYCINDFVSDYNAYRGNAYGLANTLKQTAVLKPSMKSKRVPGLYFAGQLTVPGPGVPPSLISGQVVADLIAKDLQHSHA